jgi:hypothetical protein
MKEVVKKAKGVAWDAKLESGEKVTVSFGPSSSLCISA